MALKELEVRYATKRHKDYKLADGEGLYLLVRPNGSKLWRMNTGSTARRSCCPSAAIPISALQTRGSAAQRPGWRWGRAGTPAPATSRPSARPSSRQRVPGMRTARAISTTATPGG